MNKDDWFQLASLLLTLWTAVITTISILQAKKKPQPKKHAKRKRKR